MHILNNGRMSLGTGSVGGAKTLLDLAIDHVQRAAPVRPAAGRLRAGAGQDRLDGLLPVRARVDGLPDHRPGGRRRARLLARVGHLKVSGTEFLWYQVNRALQLAGGAGYMRDRALREVPARHRIFPIFEGANDVMRAFIALSGMKPLGEELGEPRRPEPGRPDRLARRAGRLRGRPHQARGAARPGHAGPRRARAAAPTRSPTRSSGCARSPSRCCASTAARSMYASSTRSAWRTPCRTSTRRSPCSRASRASSRSTAWSPRARSATSPRPSAQRAAAAGERRARPDRAQRRRAHDGDRQAGLQARGVRLRVLRGLSARMTDATSALVLVAPASSATPWSRWTRPVVNVALPAIERGPRRRARRPAVDLERLPAHARLAAADRRLARRHLRRAAGVRARGRRLRRDVGAVRGGAHDRGARGRPGASGRGRRAAHPGGAGGDRGHLPAATSAGRPWARGRPGRASATVLGPLIGGQIVDNASWRWIFAINVPLVLVTIVPDRCGSMPGERRSASAGPGGRGRRGAVRAGPGGHDLRPDRAAAARLRATRGVPVRWGGRAAVRRLPRLGARAAGADAAARSCSSAATSRSATSRPSRCTAGLRPAVLLPDAVPAAGGGLPRARGGHRRRCRSRS